MKVRPSRPGQDGAARRSDDNAGKVLAHRSLALLWSGRTVSIAGNGIFNVALPLEVLRITARPIDLAIVFSANTIPMVALLPVSGALVDRASRRMVMMASDLACGISISLVAALIAVGHDKLVALEMMAVLFGIASSFFLPASNVIIRDILPKESLAQGNSLFALSQSLAQSLAGPLLGGVIVATIGTAWAFGIDGLTFFVSACCLIAMGTVNSPRVKESSSLAEEIRAGLRYSRSEPWLWWSMIGMGVANLVCFVPIFLLQPLIVRHVLHAGAFALGVVYAASGLGGTIASLLVKRAGAPKRRIRATWTAFCTAGLACLLLGLSGSIWEVATLAALAWAGITYGNILWSTAMQEQVPQELLGRVSSVDLLLSLSLGPVGMIAAGSVAEVAGVRFTLILGGAIAASAAAVVFIPGVTAPDRTPEQVGNLRS